MFYFDESINENESLNLQNNESFLNQSQDLVLDILPNIFKNIYEDEKINNEYYFIPSHYSIGHTEIKKNNILKSTKSTETKINLKNEENDGPKLYTPYDILNLFNKDSNKNKISEYFKSINFNTGIEEKLQLTRSKRKMDYFEYIDYIKDNKKKQKKRGRKIEILDRDNRDVIHDKMCTDNIIKKVKSAIFKYSLYFLNNILTSTDETCSLYHVKLARLNYKYVDQLKKKEEFEILNMNLKDIFSKDISPKVKKYNSNYNKQIIENILNNKKVNDTLLFVFNMTLRNWLDIFTLKKSVIEIINECNDNNYNNIDSAKIEKSLVGVDKLLNEIKEKNGEDYLPHFILCLYNYERWFCLKRDRKNKKKNNKFNENSVQIII